MKPFQIVILAAFALAALGGLLFFANFSGFGGSKDAVGAVTIWGPLPKEAVEAGLNELSRANDGYKDVIYVEKPAEGFGQALANAIASGAGPDLVIITQEQLLAERGKLSVIPFSTISERTFVNSFLPEFELFLTGEGTYGIPLALDPVVMFYNRPLLTSAGIATAPATWEMLNGYATIITKKAGNTITESLIPFGTFGNIANARALISLLFIQSGASITQASDTGVRSALVSSDTATANAVSALAFYTQFADPAKSVYTWNRSLPFSTQAFLSGDLALYPALASERLFLSEANPNLDYDMAPIPQPSVAATRATYGVAYAFALPKQSMNPAGAIAAALALSEPTYMSPIATALGMAPARRALLAAAPDDKYASVYYQEALIARGWLSPEPSITDGIFSAMIENVITGRTDVSEALTKASQSLDAMLR